MHVFSLYVPVCGKHNLSVFENSSQDSARQTKPDRSSIALGEACLQMMAKLGHPYKPGQKAAGWDWVIVETFLLTLCL